MLMLLCLRWLPPHMPLLILLSYMTRSLPLPMPPPLMHDALMMPLPECAQRYAIYADLTIRGAATCALFYAARALLLR